MPVAGWDSMPRHGRLGSGHRVGQRQAQSLLRLGRAESLAEVGQHAKAAAQAKELLTVAKD